MRGPPISGQSVEGDQWPIAGIHGVHAAGQLPGQEREDRGGCFYTEWWHVSQKMYLFFLNEYYWSQPRCECGDL